MRGVLKRGKTRGQAKTRPRDTTNEDGDGRRYKLYWICFVEHEYECDLAKSGNKVSPYGNRERSEKPTTDGRRDMSHSSNNPISFVSGEQEHTGSACFTGPVNAMNPSSGGVDQSNWEGSKGEWPTPHISEEADNTDYKELYAGVEFYDDVNGGPLRKDLMIEARKLEMQFFRQQWGYILR